MNTDALIWIIVVAVSGVVANIATVIAAFRRRPSADAQFADALKNEEDHARLHKRITTLTNPETSPFVFKQVFAVEEHQRTADREEMKRDLKVLLQRTAHLAGFGEDKA